MQNTKHFLCNAPVGGYTIELVHHLLCLRINVVDGIGNKFARYSSVVGHTCHDLGRGGGRDSVLNEIVKKFLLGVIDVIFREEGRFPDRSVE